MELLDDDQAASDFEPPTREIRITYAGKATRESVIAETLAVPLQRVRTFGAADATSNQIIFGDNLQVMKTLLQLKERGDFRNSDGSPGARLIYMDPPFATRREFRGAKNQRAYEDRVSGTQFLEFLRRRLILSYELLSDNGVLYCHLDYRKAHYIKVLLDEIFGEENFMNEIAWCYAERELSTRQWNRKHDTILVYAKDRPANNHVFNWREAALDYSPGTIKKYDQDDGDGRKFQIRGRFLKGSPYRQKQQLSREIEKKHPDLVYRDYLDDHEGIRPRDWWSDIPFLNRASKDRFDYPSAKNPALLERIIRVSSNPGDLVLDPFAGSGTTGAVAQQLGRSWVMIDSSKLAIYTQQSRMLRDSSSLQLPYAGITGFSVSNAGLYDFELLKHLPWSDWRFFALQLFGCRENRHKIAGIQFEGTKHGHSVLVYDFHARPSVLIDEQTIRELHDALRGKVGRKLFIVAPRGVFAFQHDYIDLDDTRYYTLRIPYSFISELHKRDFSALLQPAEKNNVNASIESVGFDFIRVPEAHVELVATAKNRYLKIKKFVSYSIQDGVEEKAGKESLALLMLDYDYDGVVMDLDKVVFADELEEANWKVEVPPQVDRDKVLCVLVDVHGNEINLKP